MDYFSFTSRSLSLFNIKCLLGLEYVSWEVGNGAHGFKESVYFHGIKVFFNKSAAASLRSDFNPDEITVKDEDYLIWLDMSGSGCRAFETFGNGDFDGLFQFCLSQDDLNVTRLDIAFDDHTGLLDIYELKDYTDSQFFVSKMRYGEVTYAWDRLKRRDYKAFTLYFGSKKSDVIIRIYDKAKERNKDELHWIRVETQFRHDNAAGFLRALIGHDVGVIYRGVLAEYLRFVVPCPDSNMRRWSTLPSWEALLDGVQAINIFEKKGIEYNMERLEHFTVEMAGAATYTLIRAVGVQRFLDLLKNRVSGVDLNPQYKAILEELGIPDDGATDWEKEISELRSFLGRRKINEHMFDKQRQALDMRSDDLDRREAQLKEDEATLEAWLPSARSLYNDMEKKG